MASFGKNFWPKKSSALRTLSAERCGRQCVECHACQPLGSPEPGSPSIHARNSRQSRMMVEAWKECGLNIHGESHMETMTSSTGHVFVKSGMKLKRGPRPPILVNA